MKWLEQLWASIQAILHVSLTISSSSSSSSSLFQSQVQQQQQQRRIQYSDATSKPPNFLLIGNSYTNNLAPTLQSVLVDANIPEWSDPTTSTTSVSVKSRNSGGFTFPRHMADVNGGGALATLLSPDLPVESAYQFVVLQDQSQIPGFVQYDGVGTEFSNSVIAAEQLNEYIANSAGGSGAQTMFFMTWGRRDLDKNNPSVFPNFSIMQDKLTSGYMRYVSATSTPERPTFVAPVGLVFKTIHDDLVEQGLVPNEGPTLFTALYSGDGSHPSALGTYVAALTIYSSMTGWNPTDINWFPVEETQARAVQQAVARTIAETYVSNFIIYPWTATPPSWVKTPWIFSSTVVEDTMTPTATPIIQTQPPTATPILPTQQPTAQPQPTTTQPTVRFVLPSLVNNSTEAPFSNTTNSSNISFTMPPTDNTSSISFTMPLTDNTSTSILRGPLTALQNNNQSTVPHSTDDSIGAVEEGPSLTNVLSAGTRIYSYSGGALFIIESLVLVIMIF